MGAMFRQRIARGRKKEVCYDLVGCFLKETPLQKTPQSPDDVGTRFFLYTRTRDAEEITYDNKPTIKLSSFDPRKRTKVLIHGFKGSAKDKGGIAVAQSVLKSEDCNVILVDWSKGAAGQYRTSASNTQIVGRQLALLLVDIISMGSPPSFLHVIGFSLGAHIAGYAGRAMSKRGIRIARITGLDPASPLFRENLRMSLSSLSSNDAALVDIIHTDGSALWTDGFGLLKQVGHVDYFPNGGHDQPGCAHVRASVLVSHFEGNVNSSAVCNHVRGFRLFFESTTQSSCKFRAFPCASREHFLSGKCFPAVCNSTSSDGTCGEMGFYADRSTARGPLYLVTRDQPPYCGDQLQALVVVSPRTPRTRGYLHLYIQNQNEITNFPLQSELRETIQGGLLMRALAASKFGSVSPEASPTITAHLAYKGVHEHPKRIYIDMVQIADLDGNRWSYCNKETELLTRRDSDIGEITITLQLGPGTGPVLSCSGAALSLDHGQDHELIFKQIMGLLKQKPNHSIPLQTQAKTTDGSLFATQILGTKNIAIQKSPNTTL